MTTLQSATKYEELLAGEVEGAPYDYALLFKADSFFARQRARKRFKLLKAIDPKLRRLLQRGETVYFLTPGTTVSMRERFLVGWVAYYINMRALVFTTSRVLLLQIDSSQHPRELVSQLPYASIASVTSTCRLKLLDGTTHDFQHVARADRKFLTEFLTGLVHVTTAPSSRGPGIEHLCPHCFTIVPGYPPACPACGGRFKSAVKAGLLSLLFPGLGDWYLGHKVFAALEMVSNAVLWILLVVSPLLNPPDVLDGPLDMGYWLMAGSILFAAHLIDALMTHHFARKGHHPTGVAPAAVAAKAPLVSVSQAPMMPKPDLNARSKLTLNRPPPSG